MPVPALLSWSGGKDAAWTLHVLRQSGQLEVVGLLASIESDSGRAAMQGIAREVLQAQADAAGLPLVEVPQPAMPSNALYEAALALAAAQARQRWPGISRIAFGDLLLQDIRDYRQALWARWGWSIDTPLFGSDTAALARTMIGGGLQATLCCIDTRRLPPEFAGRRFDAALLDDLPPGADPCGENGEFHTCVHAGPMFAAPLRLHAGTQTRDGDFLRTDFRLA